MQRTEVNPWEWSFQHGFSHAELVEGHERVLYCAGQVARDADGTVLHPGDMAAQLELVLDNLEAVLAGGGMSLSDVIRLGVYTTDVEALHRHRGVLTERLQAAGVRPPQTLLGVAELARPEMLVEIEATAAQ